MLLCFLRQFFYPRLNFKLKLSPKICNFKILEEISKKGQPGNFKAKKKLFLLVFCIIILNYLLILCCILIILVFVILANL